MFTLNYNIKNRAFSLIELLISLVIISLLLGAFAPIITKKLKASNITVGSFIGSSQNNQNTELKNNAPQSQEDCDKFNALFIPANMNDGKNNVCVTKYNMGDNGLPISGVSQLSVGSSCSTSDTGNCCWKGQTATLGQCGLTGNKGADYSGCSRTVCQWYAANTICRNYAPEGTSVGSWRLPNEAEAKGWIGNFNFLNVNRGIDGLQFCNDHGTNKADGFVQCNHISNCIKASYNHCIPAITWINEKNLPYVLYHNYTTGNWDKIELSRQRAFSVRCVYDGLKDYSFAQKPAEKEEPNNEIRWRKPKSYRDCAPFNAMFVPKEYNGVDGKNLCVSQYNAFDTGGPIIENANNGYLHGLVSVGTSCTGDACCWKGLTSVASSSGNNVNEKYGISHYLSNYRTVCTYKAANSICHYWAPFGTRQGSWRLPTLAELEGWKEVINSETKENPKLSKWMGAGGLQLCERHTNTKGSDQCFPLEEKCQGAYGNGCAPDHIWGENGAVGYLAEPNGGIFGTFAYSDAALKYAFSVRCVTDEVMDFD